MPSDGPVRAGLASPRWWGTHAAALVLSVVFVLLGLWQLGRFTAPAQAPDPSTAVALYSAAGRAVVPSAADGATLLRARGTWEPQGQVLVPGRRDGDRTGLSVLTPLRLADGSVLVVDRGWVPTSTTDAGRAPSGGATVLGRLRPDETVLDTGVAPLQGLPRGQVERVDSALVDVGPGVTLREGYLQLALVTPTHEPAPDPEAVGDGGGAWFNAGYALQWWLFAGAVVVFWGSLVRTALREKREAEDAAAELSVAAREQGRTTV